MVVRTIAGIQGLSHIPKYPPSASDIDTLNPLRKTHPRAADHQIAQLHYQVALCGSRFPFTDRGRHR